MLQVTYDLGDPLNDTFASPDTPDFSFTSLPSEVEASSSQSAQKENQIMQEPFLLEADEASSDNGFSVSMLMINASQAQPSSVEHLQQDTSEIDSDEVDQKPNRSRTRLLINVADTPSAVKPAAAIEVSTENKENQPLVRPQLPTILEESSERTIEQTGNEESINVNEDENTHADSLQSDKQEVKKEVLEKYMVKFTINDPPAQKPESLFWKIQTLKELQGSKRHRLRPCQFWKGQNVRYPKNKTVKRCRKTIVETFLNLNSPMQVQGAYTQSVSETMMKGEITMKPLSKLKVNQTGVRVILTASRRSISFVFENNKVKIVEERGKARLVVDNAKIESIKNTLLEPCTVLIKIFASL